MLIIMLESTFTMYRPNFICKYVLHVGCTYRCIRMVAYYYDLTCIIGYMYTIFLQLFPFD